MPSEARSRSELNEQTDVLNRDLDTQGEKLTELTEDVETVRQALSDMRRSGSTEGVEAVEALAREAESRTVETFDAEDQVMGEHLDSGRDHESDLNERSDDTQADADRLGEARDQVRHTEAQSRLDESITQEQEDIAFLDGQAETIRAGHDQGEQLREEMRRRVQSTT